MTKGSTEPIRESWLDRLFRHEEINGHGMCPTYLHRWTLLKLPRGVSIYLHKFVGDDWSRDLHDHPKRFVSIGLWGSYIEYVPRVQLPALSCADELIGLTDRRRYVAPWFRTFPANHVHRLTLDADRRTCWTLVLTGSVRRPWGFWHGRNWILWKTYLGTPFADEEKSC